MDTARTHQATSPDGTRIVGRVHGEGPPLVLVPGGPGDGDTSWRLLAPKLAEQFTLYCMSTRGKGLSGDHPEHSQEHLVGDVLAFIDSIGGPIGLMGHSSGAVVALEAAARSAAVSALALYEPAVLADAPQEDAARFHDAVARVGRAAEQDRLTDGSRIFFEHLALANDAELAMLEQAGVYDAVARNVPAVLRQVAQSGLPSLSDPSLPQRLTMPVLILLGTRTHRVYARVARDLADTCPEAVLAEVPGAGHLGPQLAPEPVAHELARFFAGALTTV